MGSLFGKKPKKPKGPKGAAAAIARMEDEVESPLTTRDIEMGIRKKKRAVRETERR